MADTPALPERLSDADEALVDRVRRLAETQDTQHDRRFLLEVADVMATLVAEVAALTPAASPRREAPADAVEALAEAMYPRLASECEDMSAWPSEVVARNIAKDAIEADPRIQLVPAGHHVSPEGQTVIDGKRVRFVVVPTMAVEEVPTYPRHPERGSLWLGHIGGSEKNPLSLDDDEEHVYVVRPVGTEEADTDAK